MSISEESQQLINERLNQQIETNNSISEMIFQAKSDQKKFLPYGPLLMHIYNQNQINTHKAALLNNIKTAKKQFCEKKCHGKEACENACGIYVSSAIKYGMNHFEKVYKYSYAKTVSQEQ